MKQALLVASAACIFAQAVGQESSCEECVGAFRDLAGSGYSYSNPENEIAGMIDTSALPCRVLQSAILDAFVCAETAPNFTSPDMTCPARVSTLCSETIDARNAEYNCTSQSVPAVCVNGTVLEPAAYDDGTCSITKLEAIFAVDEVEQCIVDAVPTFTVQVLDDPSGETCESLLAIHLAVETCLGTHQPSCNATWQASCESERAAVFQTVCPEFQCNATVSTAAPSSSPTVSGSDEPRNSATPTASPTSAAALPAAFPVLLAALMAAAPLKLF